MSDTFRPALRRRALHAALQVVLALSLFVGLNLLAARHGYRHDLSRHARHSLSAETVSYLKTLEQPVKFVVTFPAEPDDDTLTQAYRDIRSMLRDYADAAAGAPAPLQVEFVDVYLNRAAAQRHGITEPNRIFVFSGDKFREIKLDEIYRLRDGEKTAFAGEQAFTAALLDVTRPGRQKIYFLTGHGEMEPGEPDPARGLSLLRDELRLRNFEVATHDLSIDPRLPGDAALLIAAGPQGRYGREAQESLRRHLASDAGRLLLLLTPARQHGLDDLLFDWGVLADDVVIHDPGAAGRSDTGDLILAPSATGHPVVDFLASNRIAVRFGPARSVRPDPGRSLDPGLAVAPLLAASAEAWGERSYLSRGTPVFDPASDLPPRLTAGTASERVPPRGSLPFSVRGGRLLVFGDAAWLGNSRLTAGGNAILAFAAVNWLAERDAQLALPPRPIERFQLSLSSAQLARLRLALLLILPASAAVLGLLVAWNRRR